MVINLRETIKSMPVSLDEDGKRGQAVSASVVENAVSFFEGLPGLYKKWFVPDAQLSSTAHGTIVFDWYSNKSFVSVEVGRTKISYFSELPDGSSPSSYGDITDEAFMHKIHDLLDLLNGRF